MIFLLKEIMTALKKIGMKYPYIINRHTGGVIIFSHRLLVVSNTQPAINKNING